jgi:hypothetical protein
MGRINKDDITSRQVSDLLSRFASLLWAEGYRREAFGLNDGGELLREAIEVDEIACALYEKKCVIVRADEFR